MTSGQEGTEHQVPDEQSLAQPENQPKPNAGAAPEPEPSDTVVLSKAERDELFATNRRLQRQLRTMQEAEEKRRRDAERAAAEAAGEYDKALRIEREAREKAESRATKVAKRSAVRDAAAERGLSAGQAKALARLIDLNAVEVGEDGDVDSHSLGAAVESVLGEYPDLFKADKRAGARAPAASPANPPRNGGAPFEGYVSPEEYAHTPFEERMSPEFQKRVERSQAHWPDVVPAKAFAQE